MTIVAENEDTRDLKVASLRHASPNRNDILIVEDKRHAIFARNESILC